LKTAPKHQDCYHAVSKFSSGPCRIHDPASRKDWEVEVDLGGATCRLFIPSNQHSCFSKDGAALRIAPGKEGMLPFPILMPSFSRSCMDPEVGLLDLTGTIVNADGKSLDFLQIVAVKPSEVDKYRASAPFFVVMELPRTYTLDHPEYGAVQADKLGIGFARHWLMKLADTLKAKFVFMMDDSVRCWRGVTLALDPHSTFGNIPGKKAQFTNVPLGQVLEHFAEPDFMGQELPKFSALGFARFCPDLYQAKCGYRRGHVYSAFLLNVPKLLHEQGVNFNQDLYVWEDLEFNLRAHDVCKCFRFVMVKKPYTSGGCTSHIARSENPWVRAQMAAKFSPEQIAGEVLGEGALGSRVHETAIVVSKRSKKNGSLAIVEVRDPAADAAAEAELIGRSVFELERDPALQIEGAVCDEKGMLLRSFYKKFIPAFKDKERSCLELTTGTVNLRPGMRKGEEWPDALRVWDDTRRGKTTRQFKVKLSGKTQTQEWGAGWIADHPFCQSKGQGSRWFNVKTWNTWRLVFIMARLQRAVWMAKGDADGFADCKRKALARSKPLMLKNVRRTKFLKRKGNHSLTPVKRKRLCGEQGSGQKVLAICDQGSAGAQRTLLRFFTPEAKKSGHPEAPAAPAQPTLLSFFKASRVKVEVSASSSAASSA